MSDSIIMLRFACDRVNLLIIDSFSDTCTNSEILFAIAGTTGLASPELKTVSKSE